MQRFEQKYCKLKLNSTSGWNEDKIALSQLRIIKEFVNLEKYSNLLDLGCGDGKLSLLLSKSVAKVDGIDISKTAIEWAKERAFKADVLNVDFRDGNVLDLPYKENQFDLVLDSFCFHCIIGENQRKIFLENALRVLKDQASLLIMTKCGTPKRADYPFDPASRCKN